eukprot:4089686-Amphidinium_carterae.1
MHPCAMEQDYFKSTCAPQLHDPQLESALDVLFNVIATITSMLQSLGCVHLCTTVRGFGELGNFRYLAFVRVLGFGQGFNDQLMRHSKLGTRLTATQKVSNNCSVSCYNSATSALPISWHVFWAISALQTRTLPT